MRSWSYSTLKDYETCPHRIRLKLEKAPVPEQEENRGTVVHRLAEQYVRGELEELPRELFRFKDQFIEDRDVFAAGQMEIEEEWGFDKDWNSVDWATAWLRVKTDQTVHRDDALRIVDHKTGKRFGNEVPHYQQAQLYALAGFLRYPEAEVIETEFRYLDLGERKSRLWHRHTDKDRLLTQYLKRAADFECDEGLQPKPNRMNCRFCRYSNNASGSSACTYSVKWEER